jgi:hypothetical protein
LRFEQLSVEHGLAQESVLAIAQDKQGFIWLGTQAGLTRFDGYPHRHLQERRVRSAAAWADNWVRVLHVDRSSRARKLWVGTDGGLDRYDPRLAKTFTHFLPAWNESATQRGNGNRHVRAITDDGLGGCGWPPPTACIISTPASKRFTSWHHDPSDARQPGQRPGQRAGARRHRPFVGRHRDGIGHAGAGRLALPALRDRSRGDSKSNAVQSRCRSIARRRCGSARWADWNNGACWAPSRSAAASARARAEAGRQHHRAVRGCRDQRLGRLAGDGLFRWLPAENRLVQYRHQFSDTHSVADNQISALFRDRVGTFWVGTWNDGVSRVDMGSGGFARIVRQADTPDSLSDNKIRAIVPDGRGQLWLGSSGGLNLYDPVSGTGKVWRHDPLGANSLSDDQVTALGARRTAICGSAAVPASIT